MFEAADSKKMTVLKGKAGYVISVAVSADCKRIASGHTDGTVLTWDASAGQEVFALTGHTGAVRCVAFSADGKRLASGGVGTHNGREIGEVRTWDTTAGQGALTFRADYAGILAISPDGKRLASGGHDKIVRVWDAVTGQQVTSLKGHTGPVRCVAFSPDGRRLVWGVRNL